MAEINPMVPVSALRAIAVEAIRSVTGCPDVSGNGKHLTDEIEAVARAAAESLRTTSQPVGVPEGWKLVPIKCTEAMKDVGYPFEYSTISDGRLLAQSMWNELLAASPTPPAAQGVPDADDLAQFIRKIDGNHKMGAGALAEHIVEWLSAAPTAAGDEAKPMTEDELNSVWQASISDVNNRDFKTLFARAIERHHGIVASAEAGKVGG